MKKLLAIFLLLVSANAFAQFHHGHHFHRHGGGGNWIAPLIGGAIIGAVITDAARNNPPTPPVIIQQPPQPIYQPNTYSCLVQVYDPITRTIKNEVMLCGSQ